MWSKDSKEALYVRRLSRRATSNQKSGTSGGDSGHSPDLTCAVYDVFRPIIERRPPEVVANIIICIIHQTNYLLDQQIRQLERAFVQNGGLREAMTRARLAERDKHRRRAP